MVFPSGMKELIRSELFSIERLEQHAESLAAAQQVTTNPRTGCRHLARRLKDNGRMLFDAYRDVEKAVREDRAITPADEWLLDNFYVAQEQIRQTEMISRAGFIAGCPSLPEDHLRAVRGYSDLPGRSWRTRTAGSIDRCSSASWALTSACNL